jgi:hypothetical protein
MDHQGNGVLEVRRILVAQPLCNLEVRENAWIALLREFAELKFQTPPNPMLQSSTVKSLISDLLLVCHCNFVERGVFMLHHLNNF